MIVVGETGPELWIPTTPGRILPAGEVRRILRDRGGEDR